MPVVAHGSRLAVLLVLISASGCEASPRMVTVDDPASPLRLERKIALPNVKGRIDHLALDPAGKTLFVAEYASGSVDKVDLPTGAVAARISGLHEPQGIAVLADGQLVVASGDGLVHFYAASDLHQLALLNLGDDADNVQIDPRNGHLLVGYGTGALAVIDPATHRLLATLDLSGHPEGFRPAGSKVFINVPDRRTIVVADLDTLKVIATWSTGLRFMNFPLAVDPTGHTLALAYRLPATLEVRNATSGAISSTRSTCGDADDLFFAGDRLLLVCGEGFVDVGPAAEAKQQSDRVKTAPGVRTGLFVPSSHSLFLAVPARVGSAAVWVLHLIDPLPPRG